MPKASRSKKGKPTAKSKRKAEVRRPEKKAKAKAKAKAEPQPKKSVGRAASVPAPKVPPPSPLGVAAGKPASPPPARKTSRKTSLRRGPNDERFAPGELLLPGGPQVADEVQYLLRGCAAAERPTMETTVVEILARGALAEAERNETLRSANTMAERFGSGTIEPLLPNRVVNRRNFQGVVERAKHRRREIGAFLRGLDLGRTESSHMDSHGEASLHLLMEWAARLENLVEADEPNQADYAQFHRGLDQLENTTEALIVDVELTLRRLRDRVRSS